MKIDLSTIDEKQFKVVSHILAGEEVFLITPQLAGVDWTQGNKHLRSSLWNKDGELVSAGLPKFSNFFENPEHFPVPTDLNDCKLARKIDGSLVTITYYKGNLITRSRGTVDATKLDTGYEVEILKRKYPAVFNKGIPDTWPFSYIYEWVGKQKIVIDYGSEPDIYLIGVVRHEDYSLFQQETLDRIAEEYGVKRPGYFSFNSISEMLKAVEALRGEEGLCCYSNGGQSIHKVKSLEYCKLHFFKSNVTLDAILEVFAGFGFPEYHMFREELIKKFDYECFQMAKSIVEQVCEAKKRVDIIVENMYSFVAGLNGIARREQAALIKAKYDATGDSGFVFKLLDGKTLDKNSIKKLIQKTLEN